LLLSFIALVGCGTGSEKDSSSGQALVLLSPEPVTTSFSGNTFSVSFSGEDADLSFAMHTDSFTGFASGGGWIQGEGGPGKASFGFIAGSGAGPNTGHLA